jgi:hypothetical protein
MDAAPTSHHPSKCSSTHHQQSPDFKSVTETFSFKLLIGWQIRRFEQGSLPIFLELSQDRFHEPSTSFVRRPMSGGSCSRLYLPLLSPSCCWQQNRGSTSQIPRGMQRMNRGQLECNVSALHPAPMCPLFVVLILLSPLGSVCWPSTWGGGESFSTHAWDMYEKLY